MPAGDTADRSSAYTRWTKNVSEWEVLADEKGLEAEFIFVGAHRLLTALTEPRHAGRVRYWFGAEALTPEWQGRRLDLMSIDATLECSSRGECLTSIRSARNPDDPRLTVVLGRSTEIHLAPSQHERP